MAGIEDILGLADHIRTTRGGRSDTIGMTVPVGTFVVPARDVSAIGDGDTKTGAEILSSLFPDDAQPGLPGQPIAISRGEFTLPPSAAVQHGEDGLRTILELLKAGR